MRMFLVIAAGLATVAASVSAANAADLPRRKGYSAPPPVVAPMRRGFNWTGAYVGAHAGYGWGKHTKLGSLVFPKANGAHAGVQAGYNYQMGSVVVGAEGDISRTGQVKTRRLDGGDTKSHLKTLATARVRAGLAADRGLFYVTGGYAGGDVATRLMPDEGPSTKSSKWLSGYAVGAGAEYAATDNVTVKGEYLYADLGSKTFARENGTRVKTGYQDHLLRAGVNYKF